MDFLDDACGANGINLTGFHDLKSTIPIVVVVGQSAQRRADAGMNVAVVSQKTLLRGVIEVSAVVNAGLLSGCSTKNFWPPGVKMRIEVDDRNGTICAVHATKQRKGDRVVAAQCDHARESPALERRTDLARVGCWCPHHNAVMALFDLVDGPGIIVPVPSQSYSIIAEPV